MKHLVYIKYYTRAESITIFIDQPRFIVPLSLATVTHSFVMYMNRQPGH